MANNFPMRGALLAVLAYASAAVADAPLPPYAPAAGQPGSTAIPRDDPGFSGWATGYQDYLPGSDVDPQWQSPDLALGAASGDAFDIVSLGSGGQITLTFDVPISDGTGWDFAVFENSFNDSFLELAYVEVSSNGSDFVRFDHYSFTPGPVGGFGALSPEAITGYAGKYRQGYGTPFDLWDLAGNVLIDITRVTHVRLVDVVGDGTELDSAGRPIFDPYPTAGSAGFDLEAVGVIHQAALDEIRPVAVPVPGAALALAPALLGIGLVAQRRAPATARWASTDSHPHREKDPCNTRPV